VETVTSADGTVIAYDRTGDGPILVVSVGAFCTRHTFVAPAELTRRFTVVTYDRRGRGDSGDTAPFASEREYEDLAAVAAATGTEPPFVFGHSSGAAIALRAAARGLPVAGIAAYEAPFTNDETPPPGADPAARIRELVAAGRDRDAVIFWMTDVVHVPGQCWHPGTGHRRRKQPCLVPALGGRAGRRCSRRAAGDAGWVRPQCAAGGARPHPGRVLHRGTLTLAPWTAVLKCFTYALTPSDVR
jgi:pimeloyl-ACP methyl ester carboxylesterase